MKKSSSTVPILIGLLLALCCCSILATAGLFYAFYQLGSEMATAAPPIPSTDPFGPTPTPFEMTRLPPEQVSAETLRLLQSIIVPLNDPYQIACRLQNICDVPTSLDPPAVPLAVGARQTFWVSNNDTDATFQVQATLRYITPHAYFWAEDGVNVNEDAMRRLMDTFEAQIYPTNREFFGSEWTPGVDGDPHIYILYVNNIGFSVAGYYSTSDEYHPLVQQYSNTHEMFYLNASQSLSSDYTYSVLAHEFQHMIHWNQDGNEGSFIEEGFAELAVFLNGYNTGGFDLYYANDPDLPLTDWLSDPGSNTAHYGANFLFAVYFLDRFGEEITRAVVQEQANGLDSIDAVLTAHQVRDPLTGEVISADDFFMDFVLANFLHDPSVADGRYAYRNYTGAPQTFETEFVRTCPSPLASRRVNQYGVDYIGITCAGEYTLYFAGSTSVSLLPADPHSGNYAFWSNKGDKSNMTLTRRFDLRGVSGPVTMTYWTWYDIEENWDYAYVEASTDGEHWDILITPSGTSENPMGNSFGWGYTGSSTGWIQESVDLSAYAGQVVFIRFEYITDAAVNGEGLLLDDIEIPAIGYREDFEAGDGGWESAGFARVENILPQTFRLALITRSASGTTVQFIPVQADQTAVIPIAVGQDGVNEVVLVVGATTRFTRQPAAYQFEIR
ncbi:MAG: choice-of-anchor J domain-containing protein [Anaerolineales bacterium]